MDLLEQALTGDVGADLNLVRVILTGQRFAGVTVSPDTPLPELRGHDRPGLAADLLGPAALLACSGGGYALPGPVGFFTAWQAAYRLPALPEPLRIASALATTFPGTVAELEAAVAAVCDPGR